jgi:hypothetical protein
MSWYGPTPSTAPDNSSGNITGATASPSAGPTRTPTPLAADVSRTSPGMSTAALVSVLLGLICAGYVACLGFMLIRK